MPNPDVPMPWDQFFMQMAVHASSRSKDPSTKVGCIVVGAPPGREVKSVGYNGFPRGVRDDISVAERYERPAKYEFTVHAEMNAILNAARNGVSLIGCTLFCTLPPCVECAKAIIQSGISKIIVPQASLLQMRSAAQQGQFGAADWRRNFILVDKMLAETDISIVGI